MQQLRDALNESQAIVKSLERRNAALEEEVQDEKQQVG